MDKGLVVPMVSVVPVVTEVVVEEVEMVWAEVIVVQVVD